MCVCVRVCVSVCVQTCVCVCVRVRGCVGRFTWWIWITRFYWRLIVPCIWPATPTPTPTPTVDGTAHADVRSSPDLLRRAPLNLALSHERTTLFAVICIGEVVVIQQPTSASRLGHEANTLSQSIIRAALSGPSVYCLWPEPTTAVVRAMSRRPRLACVHSANSASQCLPVATVPRSSAEQCLTH